MIVVVGGTGKIGRYVAKELAARGLPARIITRDPNNVAGPLAEGLSLATADLDDPSSLEGALRGADSALLLLSPAPNNPKQLDHGRTFLRAAVDAGIRHVVYISSFLPSTACSIDRNRFHGTLIEELKASRLQWTVLRANYIFQNLIRFYGEQIRTTGRFSISPDESAAKIAMLDARDIGAVAAACLDTAAHQGQEYLVTGPEDVTFQHCADTIASVIGSPVSCIVRDAEEQRKVLASQNLSDSMVDAMMLTARQFREGLFAGVTDTIPRLTGRPAVSLGDFVREFASSFRP